ncbi:MAG TPA: hypothetical protein VMP12_01190 [Candidatus Sulfotelmatobacter sp.]|nr:hypothetical protein [Candidatus Sulfotelmatobacter sp.]
MQRGPFVNQLAIAALLARAQSVRLGSIFLRLDGAIKKCQMVRNPIGKSNGSLVASAQQTFDDVDAYIWKYKLDHTHFDQITAKLERLKFEIAAAKERSALAW